MDSPREGEGAPVANRDEGMGVEVARLEGGGLVGDGGGGGVWQGGRGGEFRGALRPANHAR